MAAKIATEALAPFKVGLKEVYLPDFSITLHRTPKQPANFASFTVPLWFSKLDLRDYLYHAYDVRINSVRSYVKLQRVTQGKPFKAHPDDEGYKRPQYKRWYRPPSIKRMTVELERPFVWPEEPEDFKSFNQEQVKEYEEDTKKMRAKQQPTGDTVVNEQRRESMREQAKALLEGKAKWKPVATRGFAPRS